MRETKVDLDGQPLYKLFRSSVSGKQESKFGVQVKGEGIRFAHKPVGSANAGGKVVEEDKKEKKKKKSSKKMVDSDSIISFVRGGGTAT